MARRATRRSEALKPYGSTTTSPERAPAVRVLILTTFGNDEYVGRALRAGAAGFFLEDSGPEELIHAV